MSAKGCFRSNVFSHCVFDAEFHQSGWITSGLAMFDTVSLDPLLKFVWEGPDTSALPGRKYSDRTNHE